MHAVIVGHKTSETASGFRADKIENSLKNVLLRWGTVGIDATCWKLRRGSTTFGSQLVKGVR